MDPLLVKRWISGFVFYYPFFMSYFWMIGGLLHFFLLERGTQGVRYPLVLLGMKDYPRVSIIVPCYNEEANVREVIDQLVRMRYPNYDIIAVNDGSSDRTGERLNELADRYPQLVVIHQSSNQGKAIGLTTAAQVTDAEYLMCIDGDSILDVDAVAWMIRHLLENPIIGAVTGNPRIRTRSTLLGRMQVGEFSSIVGLIKRTQQVYGRLLTVSGVVVMFRKHALEEVGYWSNDMLTEDIDISWKLQVGGWLIRYEPRALSWILMPETFRGLYKQRLRWAKGGIQALIKYAPAMLSLRQSMMWPIFIEYALSVVWAYNMLFVIAWSVLGFFVDMPPAWRFEAFPRWHGTLLFMTCVLQLLVGCYIDRRYDDGILRYFIDTVWYPVAFWILNLITTVVGFPAVAFQRERVRARWTSPDRGIQQGDSP
ncbi:poly-beta-1,6 N-acetyl-D-glucosamine synthase [Ralstonia solanacearum]|uniref:poly-beta-1,6-N-acetyl-D-glucosamine synthase n=1 Tax=Ralstonia solanacearum TaxID=305 RepID=UPI0005C468C5|nr:poly-beta-1,6-N-acetyl-D-glucosamine synthase [Ralstonia solanacearum]MBB6593607.1 poly-beta-1,6 N-acetyl-D-glucosamine synthase [Ralstonia solanacearum]MBB6597838.1 poly-beta-1,6 N-acetyl-D-glucosamine synthase [Ralstonia solanacearum]MDB0543356.1 poly-beta-1,6 N-acetyl-D-glucosamine synthase [Ralstonia solanacearum]MDB0553510.1 poly-beta-1,6 N-acetyl-D-glucosamine synthase [Ralstonia solanacearum]MDB0558320.1 poly-beta-1,6 N-acetyl-D-glucosamine synthase [Ralstonia solanacearum]